MSNHPLIDRATSQDVNQVTGFAAATAGLDIAELCRWYRQEVESSPKRGSHGGKKYFVGHSGIQEKEHFGPGAVVKSGEGRKEEHLATGLFNDYGPSSQGLVQDDGSTLFILDYQLPLKAKSTDEKVGKVDLLAITSTERLAVVELKYMPVNGTISRADTPLRAFLEGLAYCAILEADIDCIHSEAVDRFDQAIEKKPSGLVVLANNDYWKKFLEYKEAETWTKELTRLAAGVQESLDIPVAFLSLVIPEEPIRYEEQRPRFIEPPQIKPAW